MNIFICDDEAFCIEEIKKILINFFDEKKIPNIDFFEFTSGEELLKSNIIPDLVFLDIELNDGMSGTNVGKRLQDHYPTVKIFIVTSHIDYLDEAFRFSFFRYILKPVKKHSLIRNVEDALYQQKHENKEIKILTKDGQIIVTAKDIIAIKVEKRGTLIFLRDDTIFSIDNITTLEEKTKGMNFFRTHREYIVNFRYIVSFDDFTVFLKHGDSVNIEAYLSRPKRLNFKKAFIWYRERVYDYL